MAKLLKNLKPYLRVFLNNYMPRWIIFSIDILVVIGAFITLWLIRDSISQAPAQDFATKLLIALSLYTTTSLTLKTYRGVVRFSSVNDANKIAQSAFLASAGYFVIGSVCTISPSLNPYIKFHLWFPLVHGLMVLAGQLIFRFTVRSIFERIEETEIIPKKSRAFFLGTDKETVQIVNNMLSDKSNNIKPVAFIQTVLNGHNGLNNHNGQSASKTAAQQSASKTNNLNAKSANQNANKTNNQIANQNHNNHNGNHKTSAKYILGLPVLPEIDKISEYMEKYKARTLLLTKDQLNAVPKEFYDNLIVQGLEILLISSYSKVKTPQDPQNPQQNTQQTQQNPQQNTQQIQQTQQNQQQPNQQTQQNQQQPNQQTQQNTQQTQQTQQLNKIKIEDLLGRNVIEMDKEAIRNQFDGQNILITGAAGSIGAEIARQVVQFHCKKVILVDQAETPLNDLWLELEGMETGVEIKPVMANVSNKERMHQVFQCAQASLVFHAAAYKHVPMMEFHPSTAVVANVLGTKNCADLSLLHNVKRFVMVSTDKAVNPTNVMGATKRAAEMYIQSLALEHQDNPNTTKFVTTRFGNVLGSNGSVVPLFRRQIEKGGPVTITHRDITRYFMTIPEACSLVLEAGCMGNSGEIYIFDMGEAVKIYDLAQKMIRLSGKIPGKDIEIKEVGLRPGEKLYEELLANAENTLPTYHKKIMIAMVRKYSLSLTGPKIDNLIQTALNYDTPQEVVKTLKLMIPEFRSVNSQYCLIDQELQHQISNPPIANPQFLTNI